MVTAEYSPRVTITCGRCESKITSEHYHCLDCDDFNICAQCAAKGIYCEDDTHSWMKYIVEDGHRSELGFELSPKDLKRLQSRLKRFPSRFQPPSPRNTPQSMFDNEHRFINHSNPREILIYTDGACLDNGSDYARAGCAFVYRPSAFSETGELTHSGTIKFRLETRGPTGQVYKQTSNRAELRAVIGALQFRNWSKDCNRAWRSVVIATDSEYVAVNATERAERWESEGWKLTEKKVKERADVKNQDLWKLLLREICLLQQNGVSVSFWRIPKEWNQRAHKFAKLGADDDEQPDFLKYVPKGPARAIRIPQFTKLGEDDEQPDFLKYVPKEPVWIARVM